MKKYSCQLCNLSTNLLADYKKHLKTKKHERKTKETALKSRKRAKKEPVRFKNESK